MIEHNYDTGIEYTPEKIRAMDISAVQLAILNESWCRPFAMELLLQHRQYLTSK